MENEGDRIDGASIAADAVADAASVGNGAASASPVSPLWVLGTFVLLLGLVGGTLSLLKPRGEVLEPSVAQAELFASVPSPLAYGLEVQEARRLPSKELVLTYARPVEESAGSGGAEPVDAAPLSLTIMGFPAGRAQKVLEEQFQKLRFDSGDDKFGGGGRGGRRGRGGRGGRRGGGGGPGGGDGFGGGDKKPKLQDAGFMDWQGFSANYAQLRHTPQSAGQGKPPENADQAAASSDGAPSDGAPEDGVADDGASDRIDSEKKKPIKTYDTVRVNLSTGGRCIIAYVRFPIGAEGSKEAAMELLGSFVPLP